MGRIKDLSNIDKPREKALRFGIETLSDEELLALIINSGTVGYSSLDIARALLNDCHYLSELLFKPSEYFKSFKGLKEAKSLKLVAALEVAKRINEKKHLVKEENDIVNSESLFKRYSFSLGHMKQEVLVIIILNKNKKIVYEKVLYQGNDTKMPIDYRQIIHLLVMHNAYYFYLIHNHPNDMTLPSNADIEFTEKMIKKARNINVELLDHLIVTLSGYYSFLNEQFYSNSEKLEK